jgi:hypothetical protein
VETRRFQDPRELARAVNKVLKEHASGATVIWAMTTPIRQRGAPEKLKEESTERVTQRNRIAAL